MASLSLLVPLFVRMVDLLGQISVSAWAPAACRLGAHKHHHRHKGCGVASRSATWDVHPRTFVTIVTIVWGSAALGWPGQTALGQAA